MTPEEKAKELRDKIYDDLVDHACYVIGDMDMGVDFEATTEAAKSCALIVITEMITIQEDFYGLVLSEPFRERVRRKVEYLESVKAALEAM